MNPYSIPEKRFVGVLFSIQKIGIPYRSSIFQKLLKKCGQNSSQIQQEILTWFALFEMFLMEYDSFIKNYNEHYFNILTIIKGFETGTGKETIQRYCYYSELKNQGISSEKIQKYLIEREIKNTPEVSLKTCQTRIRKWKWKHKDLLNKPLIPAKYENMIQKSWIPMCDDSIKTGDIRLRFVVMHELRCPGYNCMIQYYWEKINCFAQQNEEVLTVKYILKLATQTAINIARRLQFINDAYRKYTDMLDYAGFLCAIVDPREAREITCCTTHQKVKAKYYPHQENTKNDEYRALAFAYRGITDYNLYPHEELIIDQKMMAHKLSEIKAKSEGILKSEVEDDFSCQLELHKIIQNIHKPVQKKYKIATWDDIVELLSHYAIGNVDENVKILKGILHVCQKKNGWGKIPSYEDGISVIKLKKTYKLWHERGFFDFLYKNLTKKHHISEIRKLRWHRDRISIDGTTNSRVLYTPFWEKKQEGNL